MTWIPNAEQGGFSWQEAAIPAEKKPEPMQIAQVNDAPLQRPDLLAGFGPAGGYGGNFGPSLDEDALLMQQLQEVGQTAQPQRMPASIPAQKAMGKERDIQAKTEQKQQTDYEKRVRDYMTKREGIALDTQNRMAKLDSMYAAQGQDTSSLLNMVGANVGGQLGANLSMQAKQQSAGRMSEQQVEMLKQKLAMQQDAQYGSLTDDAANMERMDYLREATIAKAKAAKAGKGITPQDEQRARQHFISSTVKRKFDDNAKVAGVLSEYLTALRASKGGELIGAEKTKLNSLFNQGIVLMNSKVAELGALAGQDLVILKGIFNKTTGFEGMYNNFVGGGVDAQVSNIDRILKTNYSEMEDSIEETSETYQYGNSGNLAKLKKRLGFIKSGESKSTPTASTATLSQSAWDAEKLRRSRL